MLSYFCRGEVKNPPLVFLHGFLGAKEDWRPVIEPLKQKFYCICVDLPGHGTSLYTEHVVPALLSFIKRWAPVTLVGYSFGGRLALRMQQEAPHLIRHVIPLSAHPGLTTEQERQERWEEDLKWAEMLTTLPVHAFLEKWYARPLFATLKAQPALYAQLLEKRARQNRTALSALLRQFSLAKQPLLSSPYFICGEEDLKYRALYSKMGAKIDIIPRSGHAVHLENPAELANCLALYRH